MRTTIFRSLLILSLVQASCRLLFAARPPAIATLWSPDDCSIKQSRSTLADDAVAAAFKTIIHVGAGLIHLVYGSHSRLVADLILDKIVFPPFFWRVFLTSSDLPTIFLIHFLTPFHNLLTYFCNLLT